MIGNISINDKNGNSIIAEAIAYIQFLSNNKRYILYTLNEKVEGDLTKIYIGEVSDEVGTLDKISDEEWNTIKTDLMGISKGQTNSDISYLVMDKEIYNIGIPKKLAIKDEVKQIFKDQQRTNTSNGSEAVPVMENASVSDNNTPTQFISEELKPDEPIDNMESATSDSNIFDNPMQPSASEVGSTVDNSSLPEGINQPSEPVLENVLEPTTDMATENLDGNVNENLTESISETNPFVTPVLPDVNEISAPIETIDNQIVTPLENVVSEGVVENNELPSETIMEAEPVITDNIDEVDLFNTEVTKEDAIKALEVLNKYFNISSNLESEKLDDNIESNEEIMLNNSNESGPLLNDNQTPLDVTSTPDISSEEAPVINTDMINNPTDNTLNIDDSIELNLMGDGNSNNQVEENTVPVIENSTDNMVLNIDDPINNSIETNNYNGAVSQIPPINLDALGDAPVQNTENPTDANYVATNNNAALDMSTPQEQANDIPVTLPDNYGQQLNSSDSILGPGSLPTADNSDVTNNN